MALLAFGRIVGFGHRSAGVTALCSGGDLLERALQRFIVVSADFLGGFDNSLVALDRRV